MKPQQTDWRDALGALMPDVPASPETDTTPPADTNQAKKPLQKLRVDIERKGRGGKTATIISGFNLPDDEIEAIAAELKKRLGTGGSARGGEILIQGDRRNDAMEALRRLGIIK